MSVLIQYVTTELIFLWLIAVALALTLAMAQLLRDDGEDKDT